MMAVLAALILIAGTTVAMLLLVAFSHFLFEENRTRVTRGRRAKDRRPTADDDVARRPGELQWRTVVDPVEAANRALASKPFAAAYARAMTAANEDRRAA